MKSFAVAVWLLQPASAFEGVRLPGIGSYRVSSRGKSGEHLNAHRSTTHSTVLHSDRRGYSPPWEDNSFGYPGSQDLPWQGENLPGREPPRPFRPQEYRLFQGPSGLESGSAARAQGHVGLFRHDSRSPYDTRDNFQGSGQSDFYRPNVPNVKSTFPPTQGRQQSNLELYRGPASGLNQGGPMGYTQQQYRGTIDNETLRDGPRRGPYDPVPPREGGMNPMQNRPPQGAPGRRHPQPPGDPQRFQGDLTGFAQGGNRGLQTDLNRNDDFRSGTASGTHSRTSPASVGSRTRPSSGIMSNKVDPRIQHARDSSQVRPGGGSLESRMGGGLSQKDLPGDRVFDKRDLFTNNEIHPVPESELDGIARILMVDIHSEDEREVVGALNKLASGCVNESSRFKVYEAGGHTVVLRAMRKWYHSHAVQSVGCRTLQNMCLSNGVPKNVAANLGAFDVVCSAMKNFPSSELVQECGCGALLNLSYYESGADRLMSHKDAFYCLDRALKGFPGSRDLQYWAVSAIRNISRYEKHRSALVHAGYLNLLVEIIENYEQDEQIHEAAGAAMGRLLDLKVNE